LPSPLVPATASFLWTCCSTSWSGSRPRRSAASAPSAGHGCPSPPTRSSSRRTPPATRARSSWPPTVPTPSTSISWTCPAMSSSGCLSRAAKPAACCGGCRARALTSSASPLGEEPAAL
ncbi:hypothetical protein BAE44_0025252, partial [Dichanthelium oligosanthes]